MSVPERLDALRAAGSFRPGRSPTRRCGVLSLTTLGCSIGARCPQPAISTHRVDGLDVGETTRQRARRVQILVARDDQQWHRRSTPQPHVVRHAGQASSRQAMQAPSEHASHERARGAPGCASGVRSLSITASSDAGGVRSISALNITPKSAMERIAPGCCCHAASATWAPSE